MAKSNKSSSSKSSSTKKANSATEADEIITSKKTGKGKGSKGKSGATQSSGVDSNVAAMISWIIPIIGLVFLFTDPDDEFIKFHVLQSLLYSVIVYVVFGTVFSIFLTVVAAFTFGFGVICMLPFTVLPLLVNIIGAIKAYNNEMWEVPIIGSLVKSAL